MSFLFFLTFSEVYWGVLQNSCLSCSKQLIFLHHWGSSLGRCLWLGQESLRISTLSFVSPALRDIWFDIVLKVFILVLVYVWYTWFVELSYFLLVESFILFLGLSCELSSCSWKGITILLESFVTQYVWLGKWLLPVSWCLVELWRIPRSFYYRLIEIWCDCFIFCCTILSIILIKFCQSFL